jgi:tetratricopeptide (TPR) repeat protein
VEEGDFEAAIRDLSYAIEIKPYYATAYFNRGSAWRGLKEYRKAIEDFKKAMEIDPSRSEKAKSEIKFCESRIKNLFLIPFSFLSFAQAAFSSSFPQNQEKLSLILRKTAAYCERVKGIALYYVCIENTKDKIFYYRSSRSVKESPYGNMEVVPSRTLTLRRTRNYSYAFDYQLIKKGDELEEQRIPLKKSKRMKDGGDEPDVRYSAKYLVYGPVGFLSRYWQDYFDYEIIREELIGETLATVIKATPKANNQENRNFAMMWIDEKDGSVLQIEWEPESILDYEGKPVRALAEELETTVVWNVTYGIEKSGVRFPSQQHIQEFLVAEDQKRYIRNEITTAFDDYKFFIVETEIKNGI